LILGIKKQYFLLLALAGCGQNIAERQAAKVPVAPKAPAVQPTLPIKPVGTYASGDREISGPDDTLHVGNGLVLHLKPGSKSDFAAGPRNPASYSEARTIRQEGDGRISRVGHTLVVRPFHGRELRFTDRKDSTDEMGNVECRFLGGILGRPYWLADSALWEHTQPFLINKQSGRLTPLPYDPDISPNRKLLFIASPGLDSPATDNAIQLWSISDQTATLLWARRLQQWQPQQVRWLDNHTIAIEQIRFEPKEKTSYVRLLLP
jgi:hypothetical protein